MTEPPAVSGSSYSHVIVLRDLSTSLSACIYESLCDSDNFIVKQGGARGLSMEELIRFVIIFFLPLILYTRFYALKFFGKLLQSPCFSLVYFREAY